MRNTTELAFYNSMFIPRCIGCVNPWLTKVNRSGAGAEAIFPLVQANDHASPVFYGDWQVSGSPGNCQ
jgi:hypothetical protein